MSFRLLRSWLQSGVSERGRIFAALRLAALFVLATLMLQVTLLRAQDQPSGQQDSKPDQTQPQDQSVDNRVDNSLDNSATAVPADSTSKPDANSGPDLPGINLGPDYVIGPEDVLTVNVFDVPDLQKLKVRVSNSGAVVLPLIGAVKAAGLTVDQLQGELEKKFGATYLQDPDITVFVESFKARGVAVLGAVEKPGLYHLTGQRSLVEVLAMAGGLGRKGTGAPGRTVYVERRGGFKNVALTDGMNLNSENQLVIDLHKLVYNQDGALNIPIHPSDVITVSKAGVIYVVGAVNRQGGYVLEDKDSVTVLEAIAMASGLQIDAKKGGARIIRRSNSGAVTELPVNLGKIMAGKSADMMLAANDVLFIPNNSGKTFGKGVATAASGVISGLLVYGRL